MDVAKAAQAAFVTGRAATRVLRIRKLTAEECRELPALADACLCAEETVLRMGRSGFSLGYVPVENARWRSFPAVMPLPPDRMHELGASLYGAYQDDRFCGLAVIRAEERGWGEILDLRVDASCRRQGIGSALLDSCMGFALRRKLPGLKITVSDQHPVMCQFLEACGFRVQGVDRFLFSRMPEEYAKPQALRACALICYKTIERG